MEMDDALPLNERSKNVTPHGKIASRNHDEAAVELQRVASPPSACRPSV